MRSYHHTARLATAEILENVDTVESLLTHSRHPFKTDTNLWISGPNQNIIMITLRQIQCSPWHRLIKTDKNSVSLKISKFVTNVSRFQWTIPELTKILISTSLDKIPS
jgi:hypothetical protein